MIKKHKKKDLFKDFYAKETTAPHKLEGGRLFFLLDYCLGIATVKTPSLMS